MKKHMKKVIALFCAIALLATSFVVDNLVKEPVQVKAADEVEPISLDGFENVTISDFVDAGGNAMSEQTYSDTNGNGTITSYSLENDASLDGKLVSMKVKFEGGGGNARLDVAGSGDWSGFSIYASKNNHYMHIYTNYNVANPVQAFDIDVATAGLDSALNTEIILQMSLEFVDTTLNVGVYVNGVLCGSYSITGCDLTKFGNCLGVYVEGTSSVITVSSVEWPPEPVQLEGFGNLTLKDFGMPAGEYEGSSSGAHSSYSISGLSSLDKKLLSMKILYEGGEHKHSLIFGGNGGYVGFNLRPNGSGSTLFIDSSWAGNIVDKSTYSAPYMTASVAGLDSFINEEFILQMSFEYGEADADNKADLTIGIYINGELYNNEKFVIPGCNMDYAGSTIALYREVDGSSIIVDNVQFPADPIQLEGFKNITVKDFVDSSGNQMQETVYNDSNSSQSLFSLKNYDSFDNSMLAMRLKLTATGDWSTQVEIAGNGDWEGILVRPSADGSTLSIGHIRGHATNGSAQIKNTDVKVVSFIDNEFLLQLSFDFGTVDSSTNTANLTLGIYIDGVFIQTYTIANCDMTHFGKYMRVYRETGSSITVRGVEFDEFFGFEEVTVEDFVDGSGNVMEEKAYLATMKGAYDTFSLKDYDNFDKKKLALNVMFKYGGGNTRIDIAGVKGFEGVSMFASKQGDYLFVSSNYGGVISGTPAFPIEINKDSVGISSFVDKKFLLEMTFKYVSDNQIEVGIYVNGVLVNNQKYTLTVNMDEFGDYIGFYREDEESTILIGSVNNDSFPKDPGIQPSYRYEKITFGHFGIVNKTYPYVSGDVAVQGAASGRTTLDKTVICGDILYEGSNSSQIIWGGKSEWNGLRMFPNSGGSMQLTWYEGGTGTAIATLDSKTAGVDFVGEKYNIMLSSELVDAAGDGNVNDIKIGIWFNGVLYNQQYFYATDLGNYYGNYFSVYCATETDTVTFGSAMDLLEQPSESLKQITFFQYGIEDGTYEAAADVNTKGNYIKGDTVAGTVLCGDVQLINSSAGEIDIFLGSTDNVWTQGIRMTKYGGSTDFKLVYQTADAYKEVLTIKPSSAGVDFANEKFNLMWSMEMVDSDEDGTADDLKVGLWFNGFLYQQAYTYIVDFGENMLGNTFGTYCATGTAITLNSIYELTQLPDKSFDKITFSDFGLESGKITCGADVVASSRASAYSTLDRVVFSGDIRISDAGDYQIIYGGDAGWGGLRFIVESSGNLAVYWFKGDDSQLVIWGTPELLGLGSLTQETFNLMISTELVDDDGDGNKNDIKIGIWFNKILYEFEGSGYHIVKDWGDQLKNGFSIYGAKGSAVSVLIRNDAKYQANPNYFEDISAYRGETKTAPEAPEGYVFGGWYADAEYTEWIEPNVTTGSAWAKFVEDEVLETRAQVKVDSSGAVSDAGTSIRFITTVDGLEYKKVGFLLAKQNDDGTYGNEKDTAAVDGNSGRLVYEKLYAVGSTSTITYKPTIFSWMSDYFKTFTLNNIPKDDYGVNIKATAYWVTLDGTTIKGEPREICVDDYKTSTNMSNAYSFDFLGEDTMPITGYFGPYPASDADSMLFPDYNTDEYFQMIADCGVNLMVYSNTDYSQYPDLVKKQLEMGDKYGVGIYVKDSSIFNMSENDMMTQISNYSDYASFCGMYLIDEPGTSSYLSSSDHGLASSYSDEATILNNNNIMFYGNMYPIVDADSNIWEDLWSSSNITKTDKTAYGKYINEFYTALNPKVLSYDYYPFDDSRIVDGEYDLNLYFYNMNAIREKAVATEKPFWAFVQAGGQWNDKSEYFESVTPYYPNEGQFDWIVNTSLAFGAQGIQYFPLVQPQHFAYGKDATHWDFDRNGIIGGWGNKTQWYYYAQEMNKHIAEIDDVLMNSSLMSLVTTGTASNGVSGLTATDGIFDTDPSCQGYLTSAPDDLMIGIFDYCGKIAFYVVNYDYTNAKNVTLPFDSSYEFTVTQNAVTTEMTAESVTLSMEAGEGVLLVFN